MPKRYRAALCLLLAALLPLLAACTATPKNKEDAAMITPEEAKALLDSGAEFTLVDVRQPDEYENGHIPGAVLLPDTDLRERAEDELPQKDAAIAVYCRSGARSAMAARMLREMGYTDVRDLGGIIDWPYDTTTD